MFEEALSNPLNWLLGAVVLYLATSVASLHTRSTTTAPRHPVVVELRQFSKKDLAAFDGRSSKTIYLAVKGRVYDVTAGASFYGPDGMYGNFAGRDASRGLAKDSFDAEMLNPVDDPIDDLADLTAEEQETLNGWAQFFHGKYQHVGYLVDLPDKAE
ncbi:hypothetical protein HDU82_004590 [Entophlyctis luteolus]|nr:hypothetical protein HDU82_004590 [Entophlyctis luteolus]KAJ3389242.1 hypothetical protein HDU84_008980 [Entophlyctis sp. JEL0112]